MIRKQIYLEENMVKQISELAVKKGVSQSEIIRQSLLDFIEKERLKGDIKDPLVELVGLVDMPLEDGSENHDSYVYEVRS